MTGPAHSQKRFQLMRHLRLHAERERQLEALATAQRLRAGLEVLAAVAKEDPLGWERRRAESLALGRLRRAGWRASPDGEWRSPDGRVARDFPAAVRALASRKLAQPGAESAATEGRQQMNEQKTTKPSTDLIHQQYTVDRGGKSHTLELEELTPAECRAIAAAWRRAAQIERAADQLEAYAATRERGL